MYYFYALLSEKDMKFYYGSTVNLQKRFKAHADGKVTATKYRRPFRLVYYEAYVDLQQARLREQQVKESGSIRAALCKRISLSPADGSGQPGHPAGSRASSSAG